MANTLKSVTVSFPDTITVNTYTIFSRAQQDYFKQEREANRAPVPYMAQFYGAAALVKAGIVHVSGDNDLARSIQSVLTSKDPGNEDVRIIVWVSEAIADIVNEKVNAPLSDSIEPSLPTDSILPSGLVQSS